MINKPLHITLLSGLFLFNAVNASQFSATDELLKQTIKQSAIVLGTQANEYFNYKKEVNGIISPAQKAVQKHTESQIELNDVQIELNQQQKGLNNKQEIVLDNQMVDHEHSTLLQQMTEYQNMKQLSPNDPELDKLLKRLKLRHLELNSKLPEAPAEEEVKKPESEKKDEEPKKDGFLTYLATYCVLGATTAAAMADSIADYSFGCATSLDCFKDTFIGNHQKAINRVLVAATAYAIAYKSYSLYKAYQAEKNLTDEDIFNDDLD